ncbi:MAG TPA: phosphoglucomutase (alpha-D-glucose-1,6-bisphosphate-dependent) [Deltaproteobacteria bacterium]|nr:phosphoglucomutase (alpha-D-glucose-1,6-bisphosphate-dependent) [Deltaproteobacteria bacterium]
MAIHPLAGKPAPKDMLIDVRALVDAYYTVRPDPADPVQRVSFGTSGHRGSSLAGSFNEDHILAITQAICDYKREFSITGPLFLGRDTHGLSEPAFRTALEVLAANAVTVMIDEENGFTPTPVISHAILEYNRGRKTDLADGIVITPSHNPPADGGIKYNPPEGGPADTGVTAWIAGRANEILSGHGSRVRRIPFERAVKAPTTTPYDYTGPYVEELSGIVDMGKVASAGLRLGADALGGSGAAFWPRIAERYGLSLELMHGSHDPTFGFMTVDHDGKIRMDCSSPYAMAGLIGLKDRFDLAFGNDPDFDRHGIVTKTGGLMNPNHYLAVAVEYLFSARTRWGSATGIGKTLVSSSMIDRVAESLGRPLMEVPVGFKWFVSGLIDGAIGFGGEESAGASFLRMDGTVWTTDKDGIIMALLAAEMTAIRGRDPHELYRDLEERFGAYAYERIDVPASPAQKSALGKLAPDLIRASDLAGAPVVSVLTSAPANQAPIGGIKVVTESGWFAARPSGTEDVYKIYAESFRGPGHLKQLQEGARGLISQAFERAGI